MIAITGFMLLSKTILAENRYKYLHQHPNLLCFRYHSSPTSLFEFIEHTIRMPNVCSTQHPAEAVFNSLKDHQ